MYCCPNCFNHGFLKDLIETHQEKIGTCSFCFSKRSSLVHPSMLTDYFQPVIDLYEETEESTGRILGVCLQKDWQVFKKTLSEHKINALLSIITEKTITIDLLFTPRYVSHNSFLLKWEEFASELLYENRFFPMKAIDTEDIKELLDYLISDMKNVPRYMYRARKNSDNSEFNITDMGKPPRKKALDGRANPKGISYFYGASDAPTAIAETRPYKSESISVAKFQVKGSINLVDLRNPLTSISPFGMDDDNLVLLYSEHMPFLKHLSNLLSIPVLPSNKDFEYLPTQYLCELIKHEGFDGIIFKSSLGAGNNYVLFDDKNLVGKRIEAYIAEDITMKLKKVHAC